MSVLYLHTAPKPRLAGTDAIYQETALLQSRFGGKEVVLFPFRNPSSYLPRFIYGWHKYLEIKKCQEDIILNHVFSPGLYHFPILKVLKKPVLYSITASIRDADLNSNHDQFYTFARIIVNNQRDFDRLKNHGYRNLALVHPGLNVRQLMPSHLPPNGNFVLLMASAPWELGQFDTKGVELLLEVLKRMPDLRLVLLWRGLMLDQLLDRIRKHGVSEQVEVINQKVDIQQIMHRIHATVLLAKSSELVKSYPHSLVESLACAKPVVVSKVIAMADYIEQKQLGLVLNDFTPEKLMELIQRLKQDYLIIRNTVERVGAGDFSEEIMLNEIGAIYDEYKVK